MQADAVDTKMMDLALQQAREGLAQGGVPVGAVLAAGGEVLKFFDWCYMNGDGMATQLAYVPLPANVKTLVRRAWATEVSSSYKPH